MSADLVRCLPQTGPARLIVEVIESDAERSVCVARVPARSPFRSIGSERGSVAASLALEMAAQAAAVAEPGAPSASDTSASDTAANDSAAKGVARPVSPSASPRLLAGARDITLHARSLNADSTFRIVTTRTTLAPPLRIYRFQVFDVEQLVAEGELSTFYDAN